MVMRVHLDTDLGGDPDDVCALAMLLGWPDVEITGITTTLDVAGWRAAYVAHCLELVGRHDIPVASGAGVSLTRLQVADPVIGDDRFWPASLAPCPSRTGAALDLLHESIEASATVLAIGPCTNLALLEVLRPGTLSRAPVVLMGGWVHPPAEGFPAWGPGMDWNIQWDTRSAEIVVATAELTLAALPATLKAQLRAVDLPRLRATGPLGEIIARQSDAHAAEFGMLELGRSHARLPNDLLNFHYDPVACAVGLGWRGAEVAEMRLRPAMESGVLRFVPDPNGRSTRVVVDLDGEGFRDVWLAAVAAAQR